MKRSDALRAYQEFSDRVSQNVRHLGFAALGTVWIFREPEDGRASFPPTLALAATCAILALSFDFVQYVYATIAWGILHRRKERAGLSLEDDFKAPPPINWPTNACFYAKVAAITVCYALILTYLFRSLRA